MVRAGVQGLGFGVEGGDDVRGSGLQFRVHGAW